ncbi:MAG: HlyD family efflux transporter periplasmic adaptor subunit [Alphaproteobacteria bacterium]|nr:HlyD family efflux transporter periplasmic adaptor subunit [Alphaproteobacteria bacterium]MBO6864943.1 HlyD family efflux transporter periplasmic adaptor subunit [Alphaproteobacteria bacterium]
MSVSSGTEVKQAAGSNAARTTALLLQLEKEARAAPKQDTLAFVAVNRTRTLVAYDQAILLVGEGRKMRVQAVSNVAVIDRNAPFVDWVERAMRRLREAETAEVNPRPLSAEDFDPKDRAGLAEFLAGQVLWVPWTREGRRIGGMLVCRPSPAWSDPERLLLHSLADCYAHAWDVLGRMRGNAGKGRPIRRIIGWVLGAAALAALAIPVPQSVIAPARIVPRDPAVIAAPMDGVIERVTVDPNQAVLPGDVLLRYVSAELDASLAIADRAVDAAEADLRRARQQAFADPRSKADVALKEAELALKEVERDYGRYLVSQVEVRADTAGVAIFADPSAWRGRPVQTGMHIMQIADPQSVRVEIDVPVGDAVAMADGAEVAVFLDIDPLNPLSARLEHASYGAEETRDGVLAYRASAGLEADETVPRIGLHGTARIFGDPVPLGLYLFRKPLSAVRQFLGI